MCDALSTKSMQDFEKLFKDKPAVYVARCHVIRGDLFLERKEFESCLAEYLLAQRIITEIYGSDHPFILFYNAAIIDEKQAATGENGEGFREALEIGIRNENIALANYGEDSVFMLKHHLNLASNYIQC